MDWSHGQKPIHKSNTAELLDFRHRHSHNRSLLHLPRSLLKHIFLVEGNHINLPYEVVLLLSSKPFSRSKHLLSIHNHGRHFVDVDPKGNDGC